MTQSPFLDVLEGSFKSETFFLGWSGTLRYYFGEKDANADFPFEFFCWINAISKTLS